MPVDLKEYTDVATRIGLFYSGYPNGRLVTERVEIWTDIEPARIVVKALAYRSPDDPHPGTGWSWMVLPGTTNFTRGSELENTETSAVGRAIGMLGIGIKGSVASTDEIAGHKQPDEERTHPGLVDGDPQGPDGSLIGLVVKGTSTWSDMELRETREGPIVGFKLKQGTRRLEVVAHGQLARDLQPFLAGLEDQRVSVWGDVEMMTWRKGDREMKPYPRLHLERIQTDDWTMPPIETPDVVVMTMAEVASGGLFDGPPEAA